MSLLEGYKNVLNEWKHGSSSGASGNSSRISQYPNIFHWHSGAMAGFTWRLEEVANFFQETWEFNEERGSLWTWNIWEQKQERNKGFLSCKTRIKRVRFLKTNKQTNSELEKCQSRTPGQMFTGLKPMLSLGYFLKVLSALRMTRV